MGWCDMRKLRKSEKKTNIYASWLFWGEKWAKCEISGMCKNMSDATKGNTEI